MIMHTSQLTYILNSKNKFIKLAARAQFIFFQQQTIQLKAINCLLLLTVIYMYVKFALASYNGGG